MARAVELRGGASAPPRPGRRATVAALPGTGDAWTSLLLLAPAVVVLLVTNLYPTLNALWLSFFAYDASIPNARPVFVGLDNYRQLVATSTFPNTARITVTFVL